MKKILALTLALILCLGLLAGCANEDKPAGGTEAAGGKAKAKITVIDKDNKEFPYDIEVTDGVSLREALFEAKLITEEQYGAMFIENIDGHVADVLNDGCTWMIQDKDKKDLSASMDEVQVHDGDVLYLQYYVVPNFDD